MKKNYTTTTAIFSKRIQGTILYFFLFLFYFTALHAQTWQWGKRGGNIEALAYDPETVKSNCTDIYGNVYVASDVGINNLTIDGVPRASYGAFTGSTDSFISSFSCDGTYRWSKVIGGADSDFIKRIGSDSQGNIYATGTVYPVDPPDNPIHFDSDVTLPSAYSYLNQYNKSMYLIKYDTNGNFKWLRMPQPSDVTVSQSISFTGAFDLQVDAAGNCYWLCVLPVGTYADGAFVVTTAGNYILKYDTDGNFTGGFALDFQTQQGANMNFRMKRNAVTGAIYLAGKNVTDGSEGILIAGGQQITKSLYLIAFNSDGTFLWTRENESLKNRQYNDIGFGYDIAIDADNSIYLTGTTGRMFSVPGSVPDVFNGVPFVQLVPGTAGYPWPFITKLNANGETIWQTNGYSASPSEIVVNGNEVGICGNIGGDPIWQNLTYHVTNQGYHPFIGRFNKTTGAIIGLDILDSMGGNDFGASLTTDRNGSYYMGGKFESSMTVGPTTIYNSGLQSDFFVAKFGSSNCEFLGISEPTLEDIQGYPNPVRSSLRLNNTERYGYTLYGVLGNVVHSGMLMPEGTVDFEGLAAGLYMLRLESEGGEVKMMKVVKED